MFTTKNCGADRASLLLKYPGFGFIRTLPDASSFAAKRKDK